MTSDSCATSFLQNTSTPGIKISMPMNTAMTREAML